MLSRCYQYAEKQKREKKKKRKKAKILSGIGQSSTSWPDRPTACIYKNSCIGTQPHSVPVVYVSSVSPFTKQSRVDVFQQRLDSPQKPKIFTIWSWNWKLIPAVDFFHQWSLHSLFCPKAEHLKVSPENLCNPPKVAQLYSSRARIWIKVLWFQNWVFKSQYCTLSSILTSCVNLS